MVRALEKSGYHLAWTRVETEADYQSALETAPDIILADYQLPQFSGLRALALLKQRKLDIPLILVSGTIGEENAAEVMRLGADDYMLKDRRSAWDRRSGAPCRKRRNDGRAAPRSRRCAKPSSAFARSRGTCPDEHQ